MKIVFFFLVISHDRCDRDRMVVGFSTTRAITESVPITTKIVISNPVHGEVYSIQHYGRKFVSDLRQIDDFLQELGSGFLHQ
jgi:hypothetical protein